MRWKNVSTNYCTNVSILGNPKILRNKLVRSKLKLTDDAKRGNCEICNILKPGNQFKSMVTWLNLQNELSFSL